MISLNRSLELFSSWKTQFKILWQWEIKKNIRFHYKGLISFPEHKTVNCAFRLVKIITYCFLGLIFISILLQQLSAQTENVKGFTLIPAISLCGMIYLLLLLLSSLLQSIFVNGMKEQKEKIH